MCGGSIAASFASGLFVALVVALIASPPAHSTPLRVLELVAIFLSGFVALATVVELVSRRLAGWQESEQEFELTVRRSEKLAQSRRGVSRGEVGGAGKRAVAGAPDDRAPGRPAPGVLDVRRAEEDLVAPVGVAPERLKAGLRRLRHCALRHAGRPQG